MLEPWKELDRDLRERVIRQALNVVAAFYESESKRKDDIAALYAALTKLADAVREITT